MTRAVLFGWRGTLVTTLTERRWGEEALLAIGRDAAPEVVDRVLSAIGTASGDEDRLDGPGVDSDAALHRVTYLGVFADAGLDDELAESLYSVESDPRHNPFALDVPETLAALRERGVRVAVVSDVHFDLRPAFAAAGLAGLVDVFTISFEQGVQKPNPLVFRRTLEALGVDAEDALMVGDRSHPDGAAVEAGITTLLLPPLRDVADRRLHKVVALCDARSQVAGSQVQGDHRRSRAERDRHLDSVLIGGREPVQVVVSDHDPAWVSRFSAVEARIRAVLGKAALAIEHVGSTSVPGLAAKPIVDVLLVVPHVEAELSYATALEVAGFVLRVREAGHRMFRTPEKDVHIHVHEPGDPAVTDQLDLRDWLRVDDTDRTRYADVKRTLACRPWPDMNEYADAKSEVIRQILGRARAWRAAP